MCRAHRRLPAAFRVRTAAPNAACGAPSAACSTTSATAACGELENLSCAGVQALRLVQHSLEYRVGGEIGC